MLKKYFTRLVSVMAILLFTIQAAYVPVQADTTESQIPTEQKQYTSKRLAGQNGIETSLAIATEYSNSTLQNVILATAYNFPDALSGSVLSKKLNAPILLVGGSSGENSKVFEFIKNHLDPNGNVYILGGTGVISDDTQRSIQALGFKNFTRLAGVDSIETNLKIVNSLSAVSGTPVVIATKNNFPDALSISSVAAAKGYPILLSDLNSIDERTVNVISAIKPSQIFIIGGNAVVSANVENQLKSYSSNVVRISGTDLFETSLAVSHYFKLDTDSAIIAIGYNFQDALAGSSLAAKLNAPILLIDNQNITKQKQLLDSTSISSLYILGGTAVASESVVADLAKSGDSAIDAGATAQTLTGIIIDEDCFVAYPNPGDDPGEDTTMCLQMKACAASGYGIAVLQSNNTYKFYYFDGAIAQYDSATKVLTPGTGAQLDAWNLVHATTKKDHVTVSVTGTGTLSGKTAVSPYDGISYPVITVSSLTETK